VNYIEDIISEFKSNCGVDSREILDDKCKLTGKEIEDLLDMSNLADLYRKGLLGGKLRTSFLIKLSSYSTNLEEDNLMLLLSEVVAN